MVNKLMAFIVPSCWTVGSTWVHYCHELESWLPTQGRIAATILVPVFINFCHNYGFLHRNIFEHQVDKREVSYLALPFLDSLGQFVHIITTSHFPLISKINEIKFVFFSLEQCSPNV